MKNKTKILGIVLALCCCSANVYAQTSVSAMPQVQSGNATLHEIMPRYSNISYATPLVSRTAVGAVFGAQRSMSLSITAVAYRNGKKIDSFSASTYGTDLDFEEEASLQKGDTVKFTFNAGGEKINTSVTVS